MKNNPIEEEKAPFNKSWRFIYLVVLGNLVLLIALFYLFTKAYQ